MRNFFTKQLMRAVPGGVFVLITITGLISFPDAVYGGEAVQGKINQNISELKRQGVFDIKETKVFLIASNANSGTSKVADDEISKVVSKYALLTATNGISDILKIKPEYLKLLIPIEDGSMHLYIEVKGKQPDRIIEVLVTHATLTNAQSTNTLIALEVLNLEYNPITNFVMPTGLTALNYVSFFQCSLSVTSVNSILQTINALGTSGGTLLMHGGTNAAPTGQGIAAKKQLESRGWTVATN